MKLLYFHIDELGRDAVVASALSRISLGTDWKVVYGNRLSSHLSFLLRRFDAVILPSVNHYKTYFPNPLRLPVNVYILPSECVGQATGSMRRINAKYFGDNHVEDLPWHQSIRGFFLWGHAHLHPFQKLYPHYLNRCRVVGHPRLASVCISKKKVTESFKKRIGLISRFGKLNAFDNRSVMDVIYGGMKDDQCLQPTYENSPDIDIEDLIYTESLDLRIFLKLMNIFKCNKDISFSIKTYPRENWRNWRKFISKYHINAEIYDKFSPFTCWLSEVDYIIGPPSTSFYEVFAQGRTPICIDKLIASRSNHILTESDDNNQILDYVFRPSTFEELIKSIECDNISSRQGYEDILEEQCAISISSNAIHNIIAATDALLPAFSASEMPYKIPPLFELSMYYFLRFMLSLCRQTLMIFNPNFEQGATFALSPQKLFWIRNLSINL